VKSFVIFFVALLGLATPEVQDSVISLADSQQVIDCRGHEVLNKLLEEVLDYAKLKKSWGYAHIKIKTQRCCLSTCLTLYGPFMPDHLEI